MFRMRFSNIMQHIIVSQFEILIPTELYRNTINEKNKY